jgi:hypothetical protein
MNNSYVLTPGLTLEIARWLATGKGVGISARTIAAVALGLDDGDWDCPHDDSDFGRCYALLAKIPELRGALNMVARKCPQFAPLVIVWDELSKLYEQDRLDSGRRCYDKIKQFSDSCRIAGGWTKIGCGNWVKLGGAE